MTNHSNSTVIPCLRYADAHAAIDWLCRVLNFTRHAVYEGPNHTVMHAELVFGATGMIMIGSTSNASESSRHMLQPAEAGDRETQTPYLATSDTATLYHQAVAAGANIMTELRDMDYGGKAFSLRDPEGHIWSVGEYNPWTVPQASSTS